MIMLTFVVWSSALETSLVKQMSNSLSLLSNATFVILLLLDNLACIAEPTYSTQQVLFSVKYLAGLLFK